MSGTQPTFTGRSRKHKTHWSVRWSDVASEGIITVGGIGTIVAVCLVALVLVMEVLPLFRGASVEPVAARPAPWQAEELVHFQMNEYQTMAWVLTRDGTLRTVRMHPPDVPQADGAAAESPLEVIRETPLIEGPAVTAVSSTSGDTRVVLGFADGSVRVAQMEFVTTFLDPVELKDWLAEQGGNAAASSLTEPGDTAVYQQGVLQVTPQGQYRVQKLEWSVSEPVSMADAAIVQIDHLPENGSDVRAALGGRETTLAVLSERGQIAWGVIRQKKDLATGETSIDHDSQVLPPAETLSEPPAFVLMSALGRNIYAADRQGTLVRYDIRDSSDLHVAETVDLLPESDAQLTVCEWILGRETIFCGDSRGGAAGWFTVRLEDRQDDSLADRQSRDGLTLVRAHTFPAGPGAVTAYGASSRSRMFLVGYEGGQATLFHMTTEKQVARLRLESAADVAVAQISPRDNGLLLESGGELAHYGLSPGFPDITLASLFLPVWYEGYAEPLHMWQSSSSEIEDELKFSLFPLLFGTFKATFYSLLFGAPIALLAAIYTSEFSTKRTRAVVKPTVEMMASLPSVVLGFVAALVFAPVVEQIVPACLAAIFVVPLTILLAAYLWQLLPRPVSLRWQPYRLFFLVPTLLLGVGLSYLVGPWVEQWLFLGRIKYWLSHPEEGSGMGGWLLILLPFSALVLGMLDGYLLGPTWRSKATQAPRHVFSLLGLAKFVLLAVGALVLAIALGGILELIGWDPRGTYIGSYDQRNSLIVGFVMGFAVIPIIYTISDDALSTVPNHLRSASLGCGATQWQTTLRVVIPTAMSGLFSALMIGLGRVAGETMIVLMAGGNTPVEDWNIFNGFRTLSTNIAIELPEAVQGSSHYRVLFVSALVLFLLTFLINTVAEIVRLYFRRRAYQL